MRSIGHITVLMIKQYSEEYTAQFRYMVQKTNDPAERYQNAMQMLSSAYYQRAKEFSDEMTALFAIDSPTAARLINHGRARNWIFLSTTRATELHLQGEKNLANRTRDGYQATFWHNHLFNPESTGGGIGDCGLSNRIGRTATDRATDCTAISQLGFSRLSRKPNLSLVLRGS